MTQFNIPLIEEKEDLILRKAFQKQQHDVVDKRKKKTQLQGKKTIIVAETICLGRENRGESYSTFPTPFRVL